MRPSRPSSPAVRSGLRRNPLRRRVDRVEVFARIVAFVLLCAAVPVALAAGAAVHRAAVERSAQDVIQVTATVRQNVAPGPGHGAVARATWRTPGGVPHSGVIAVIPPDKIGDQTRIWVDETGHVTSPPASAAALTAQQYLIVVLFLVILALLLVGLLGGVHRWLDRIRYARWDREWRLIAANP